MFENKTIMVIGASGLIGSNLVERLLHENARVTVMGRSIEKLKNTFNAYRENNNLTFIEGDISNGIDAGGNCYDYIFQAASPISGRDIQSRPLETIEVNVNGVKNCLDYIKNCKDKYCYSQRLIVFSSATVYGVGSSYDLSVAENDTDNAERLDAPSIAYSESKRIVEVLARSYAKQYGVDVCILRPSYIYGYSINRPNTAFYEFINKALNGENITIAAKQMPKRDNIYINDAIDGILKVALLGQSGEAYNISSHGEMNNYLSACEMAKIICDIVNSKYGMNVNLLYENGRCDSTSGLLLENTKLKNLGWDLRYDSLNGIEETISKIWNEREK